MTTRPTTRVPARQPAGTRWASPAAAVRAARPGHRPCAAGCGWPLDPAAATGCDGNLQAFDRHPGCEPVQTVPLRAIKGGAR